MINAGLVRLAGSTIAGESTRRTGGGHAYPDRDVVRDQQIGAPAPESTQIARPVNETAADRRAEEARVPAHVMRVERRDVGDHVIGGWRPLSGPRPGDDPS